MELRTWAESETRTSEETIAWRREELERAGYAEEEALELAARARVDLHLAIELLQRGCPRDTALLILL
jgi:hypothetical protein